MDSKITLITPPDFFENSNKSLLFVNLNEKDQDKVSRWIFDKDLKNDVNFYVFSTESDIRWLFYAIGCCKHKYLDLDNANELVTSLSSYILSKSGFYYKVTDENLAAIYNHINTNRIIDVETFLERSFSD